MVIFTTDHGHYSIQKSAMMIGLGYSNVINISCDINGKMNLIELENKIYKQAY